WLQEYCCVPADEATAFITYEMIAGCEEAGLRLMSVGELEADCGTTGLQDHGTTGPRDRGPLFLGVDVARKHDLCVLDVGEKIGDVVWDRARVELAGKTFSEIEAELYRLLRLPRLKRACID